MESALLWESKDIDFSHASVTKFIQGLKHFTETIFTPFPTLIICAYSIGHETRVSDDEESYSIDSDVWGNNYPAHGFLRM